jgi:hypothetical protein
MTPAQNYDPHHHIQLLKELLAGKDAEIATLRAAAQPEPTPVAVIVAEDMGRPFNAMQIRTHFYSKVPPIGTQLYTHPALIAERDTLRAAAKQGIEALQHAMTENFRHQLAQQKIYNAKELADAITALQAALESKYED